MECTSGFQGKGEGGREVVAIKNSTSPYSDEIVLYLDCGGVSRKPKHVISHMMLYVILVTSE